MFTHRSTPMFVLILIILSTCLNIGFADNRQFVQNQLGIPVVINEIMAANYNTNQDPQREYEDWIELHNYGSNPVVIGNMFLTDDPLVPTKWRIPAGTTITGGGYILIWADEDVTDMGPHANFKLDSDGEEICLFYSDAVTIIDSVVYPEQTNDISYGRIPDAEDNWQFIAVPSPGAENDNAFLGAVGEIKFSNRRGFYESQFHLTIATETEGASIYYSLDGREPYDFENDIPKSMLYTRPISISGTTCVRAVAVKPGWKPTKLHTHTYLFLDDVIRRSQQDVLSDGYPAQWFPPYPADYEMDPEIYNDPDYRDLMDDALLAIPTLSVVTDKDNLFSHQNNPDTGGIYIYTGHSTTGGQDWERPVSAEFFSIDNEKEFQINCGIRLQGGESRRPIKCPKHSFSLRFSSEYGPAKLNFPLFDNWPVNSFDSIQLRGFFNNAWTHWAPDQRERTQYIRDQWMRDALTDMGQMDAGQGFFVHLYLNGIYWGIYNVEERPVASHYAAYNGGDKDNLDAINGGRATDGTTSAWNQLKSIVSSRDWNRIIEVLDVDNFIDWTLLNLAVSNRDLKTDGNWRAAGGGAERKLWRFYSWDAEHVIEGVNHSGTSPSSDPTGMYNNLYNIEEFRVRFGDRVHKHLFNDGALTPQRNTDRWLKRSDELELAVIAESARWGDYRRDVYQYSSGPYYLYTKNEFWTPEKNDLLNNYFPARTTRAINNFRSAGLYPAIDAPVFNISGRYQHGGEITQNNRFSISSTSGIVYYTLNGSDPRSSGAAQDYITTKLIAESETKRVLVPTGTVSDAWRRSTTFNDSTWLLCSGRPGGVGYETGSGYEPYITLDLQNQMYNGNTSCYIRIPFTIDPADLDDYSALTFRIRYDDGFIAYLNGTEIARRNFSGTPVWNSNADTTHSDAEAIYFENIDITQYLSALHSGINLIAIQGMNNSPTSSDLLISVELEAGQDISSDDSDMSPGVLQYDGPFTLDASTQVKARALSGNTWSALNEAVFAVGPVAQNLRITEIMYHPQAPADMDDPNEEYIELTNIGNSAINLNLVSFTNGIDFTFPNIELAPGEYIVVVENRDAFEARYGQDITIAGQFSGKLNNNGEKIRLADAAGRAILDFDYNDNWYPITDGEGFSLTIIDPTNPDPNSWDRKSAWRASAYPQGSPGYNDDGIIPNPGSVVINELLASSTGNEPDWIELYNTTNTSIDISGWYLSDSGSALTKYKIANGTTISPHGYIVFHQDLHFGNANDPGTSEPFALSANGESVYLSSSDNGILTGYREIEDFGPSQSGVSFGRYYKASTDSYNFVAMERTTRGSANSAPKVGPIVINEIMYNPDWPDIGFYVNDAYEYIELHNISSAPVTLYDDDTDSGWRFTDGIDFTFPADSPVTIPAGGYVLVVKNLDAFAWLYPDISLGIVYGPYEGQLSDAGETLELGMPGDMDEDAGEPYYIRIDRIVYSDGSHPQDVPGDIDLWPPEADGLGLSLHRIAPAEYGNDPANWEASTPTPGR